MAMEYGNGGDLSVTMDGPFAGSGGGGGGAKLATIIAPAEGWKGGESPYSQVVGVDGTTVSSKVDIVLSHGQLDNQLVSLQAINDNGIIKLYAYGSKPTDDLTLQASVTEVLGEGVILGNIAEGVRIQADYAQADSTRSDFIRNKPDAAIANAQKTADDAKAAAANAQTTANNALPKSGGTVSGALTVPNPTASGHAATKGYVDGKSMSVQVSLPASGWSGSGPYTQTVTVSGLLATDRPHLFPVYSTTNATAISQQESWAMVSTAVSNAGSLTFTCFEDKPTADLTLQLEVNR